MPLSEERKRELFYRYKINRTLLVHDREEIHELMDLGIIQDFPPRTQDTYKTFPLGVEGNLLIQQQEHEFRTKLYGEPDPVNHVVLDLMMSNLLLSVARFRMAREKNSVEFTDSKQDYEIIVRPIDQRKGSE